MSEQKPLAPLALMLISGTAASVGEIATIPFDTAKVRLQNQVVGADGKKNYTGLFNVLRKMVVEEGVRSPWKGVSAGVQRQMAFAPIRIGLYQPVSQFYQGGSEGKASILVRIAAGLTTSAIGITIASPTDVVKVRLQSEGRLPPGVSRRYDGSIDAYRKIIKSEGIRGLWTGYGPNLARNCVVNATELVAYDLTKQFLLELPFFDDNIFTHICSGLGAGLAATLLGSPVDVIKTRVMSAQGSTDQTGPLRTAFSMLKNEGPLSFYKGFLPNFARVGSWNIVTWVTLEQLKEVYMKYN